MKRYREQVDQIAKLLEEHAATGMSVTAIARELGIDRKTAAKYLDLLAASGDVSMKRFGQKKFCRPARSFSLGFAAALFHLGIDGRSSYLCRQCAAGWRHDERKPLWPYTSYIITLSRFTKQVI
ncbi:hypothetical protein [Methanosphaerula palustris]|nr:hypothetical protein [Methanosphaerula palustris]